MKNLVIAAVVLGALTVPLAVGGQGASDQAALQAELDALLGEILESVEEGPDPFADGAEPDLLILSTSDTQGEVAPCG
ncbi:MAG: hypothetical protein DHS20C21_20540 [Gemmatimonadota bacterium]|nr:MAG: hypothetical protein DHS20C21_20540 [Gemmatimonadota bacterium]